MIAAHDASGSSTDGQVIACICFHRSYLIVQYVDGDLPARLRALLSNSRAVGHGGEQGLYPCCLDSRLP